MSPPPSVDEDVPPVHRVAPFAARALERYRVRSSVPVWPLAKRGFDALLSAVLLLAMLPLIAVIAVAIKLDSPGPVFYRVRRVGYRGRPLYMLKFRKMYNDAQGGPLTTAGDPRLTRVGRFLTNTRLDELPQLWDVLRGRMSIIGPRPEDPFFAALHPEQYSIIHSVRPGMTGITQLAFADESNILDVRDPVGDYITRILPHKVDLDLVYAKKCRMRLDLAVLFWTVVAVFMHRPVAVHRATGRMNARRRPPAPAKIDAPARRPARGPSLPRTLVRKATLGPDRRRRRRPRQPPPAPHPGPETSGEPAADHPSPREVASPGRRLA